MTPNSEIYKISEEKIECFLATYQQLRKHIQKDFPLVHEAHIPLLMYRAYVECWNLHSYWLSWSIILRAENADQDIAKPFNKEIEKHKFEGIKTDFLMYGGDILCEHGLISYDDAYTQLKNTCLPYMKAAQEQYPQVDWVITVPVSANGTALHFNNHVLLTPGIIHVPGVDHEKVKNICEQMITQHQAQKYWRICLMPQKKTVQKYDACKTSFSRCIIPPSHPRIIMNISPSHDVRTDNLDAINEERARVFAATYQQMLHEIRLATRFVNVSRNEEDLLLCRAYADCWGLESCQVGPMIHSYTFEEEHPNDEMLPIKNKTMKHMFFGIKLDNMLLCSQGVVAFEGLLGHFEKLVGQDLQDIREEHPQHTWEVFVVTLQQVLPRFPYALKGWDHDAIKDVCHTLLAQNQFKTIQSHVTSHNSNAVSSKI